MATEAQKRARANYERKSVTQRQVKFYPKDADLLAHLDRQPSKNAYILELIRNDMERSR